MSGQRKILKKRCFMINGENFRRKRRRKKKEKGIRMTLSEGMKTRIKNAIYLQMDFLEDKVNEGIDEVLIQEQVIPRENPKWSDAMAYARKIFFKW